ncbi:MAG TPA: hypothetical protein DCE41_37340, partial [Cytophagales bacterium]|nr:hypothetical protein [Cytophagales bacterium]
HYEVANLLFFQQLTANAEAAGELVKPPEPYVPKVKELKLSYTSSATRASGVSTASAYLLEGNYITPFGARPFSDTEANYLIPKYDLEGECYLGLSPVQPGQVLSLWFQMAEGSSTPDLSVPTVIWSYPGATGWTPFPARNLLRDTTQGLTRSGMVYLQLPKVLGTSPELPSDSYWLRLGVARDAAGLPLAISVCTNGVSAVLAPGPRA